MQVYMVVIKVNHVRRTFMQNANNKTECENIAKGMFPDATIVNIQRKYTKKVGTCS